MVSTTVSKTVSQGSTPCSSAINMPENSPHVKYVPHLNAVVKDFNICRWAKNNVDDWVELYNAYYEYDDRVVKLLSFDGAYLATEALEGFNLDDWFSLIDLDIKTLLFMHHELVDMWNKQLLFKHSLIPDNNYWYHMDWLAKNLMWSHGRLRLVDPDSFFISDFSMEFSQRTKMYQPDSALKQLERAIKQVSQQLIDEG